MNSTAHQRGRSGRLLRDGGDTALRDLRRGQCRLEVQAGPDREGSCSFIGKQARMGSGTECKFTWIQRQNIGLQRNFTP